ncbi:MAG: HEAT repeat domain-containing protein [Bryobacteraceae bacterium]
MLSLLSRLVASVAVVCLLAFGQSEDGFSAKQRISRIRDLGKRGGEAIPSLTEYLNDGDRDIRVEAVRAIVKIDGEASLTPLIKATHDNDAEVQIRATDGLVNFYLPGYVAKGLTGPVTRGLRQAKSVFSSRNDQVVDQNVTVKPDVAQAIAIEISGGASADARTNAARAAGILRLRTAVPSLLSSLRARDSQLIFESLVALQKIKDPAAGPGVSPAATDLDERIQITALETIGVLHSLQSAPNVRSALTNARNVRVRRGALEALAMLGIAGDRPIFQQYAEDKDPELRASALEGLGRIREPEDYPLIERAYNEGDANWRVHLAAAFALVDQGKVDTSDDYSPLPYLFENLAMKSKATVASAYLAELVRRDDVRKALTPLISQGTRDQKLVLCSVLGESQSEEVIPVLTTLSRDIDPDVSLAASKAIKTLQARRPS